MVQRKGCGLPATRYSAPSLPEKNPAGAMRHRRRKQTVCSRSRISNLRVIGNTGAEAALRGRASSRGFLRLRLVQPTEQFLLEPAHKLSKPCASTAKKGILRALLAFPGSPNSFCGVIDEKGLLLFCRYVALHLL